MKETLRAYIAGFLDGDGSIYVKLTQNDDYKYKYQVCPYVVFYQSNKNKFVLARLKKLIKKGYIRERKDGISEYIIGDIMSIKELMKDIKPYIILKSKHVKLMLKILDKKEKIKNLNDFLKMCVFIDQFKELNYSKKRKNLLNEVKKTLREKDLLTP